MHISGPAYQTEHLYFKITSVFFEVPKYYYN